MYTLKLRHHFDAAHKLNDYNGACANLHGHRWEVEVIIKSKELQSNEMIIDFKELKSIINHLDHNIILKDCQENNIMIKAIQESGLKLLVTDFKPTAENLSKYLQEMIKRGVREGVEVSVTVWESPDASITYED